jgi:Fic family protein
MSSQIEREKNLYYECLEKSQRGDPDITEWMIWFLDCLARAIDSAKDTLALVLYKARLWEKANQQPVNERQQLIINRMLDDFKGHMNTSKYAKIAKCSPDTALRDIQDLVNRKILIKNPGGGRSTSYRLASLDEL